MVDNHYMIVSFAIMVDDFLHVESSRGKLSGSPRGVANTAAPRATAAARRTGPKARTAPGWRSAKKSVVALESLLKMFK